MKHLWAIAAAAALVTGCGPAATEGEPPQATARAEDRPPATPAPAPSESRTFRDWRAVCDNGARCASYAGSDAGSWLMVRLDAGPEARPEILADMSELSGAVVRLVIDGRPQTLVAGADDEAGLRVPAADVAATLARLAAAREVRLSAPDLEAAIPAAGASAALLWIDERQGRPGTTTALIRRGERPASTVPPPPILPVVTAAPPAPQTGFGDSGRTLPAALEALPAVKACRSETSFSDWIAKEVMSARLDASTELWAVPCFAGAYNIGHDWYVTGPGGRDPRPAALTSANGETDAGTINGAYSPRTRILSAFAKGRGLGDCGTAQTWTWTGQAFRLTTETEMQDCRGMPAGLWPTTWRTR